MLWRGGGSKSYLAQTKQPESDAEVLSQAGAFTVTWSW